MKSSVTIIYLVSLLFLFSCKKAEEPVGRPTETITIKVDHDTTIDMLDNQKYILDASTGNANSIYSWGTPVIVVDFPGYYFVDITTDTLHQHFQVILSFCQTYLFYPNSFTPNGDGIDDYWGPSGVNIIAGSLTLKIYDAHDHLLFKSDPNYNNLWDCHWNGSGNGELCPAGYYYYDVKYQSLDKLEHHDTGMLQLIR